MVNQYRNLIKNNYTLIIIACIISVVIRIPFFNLTPSGKDSFTIYWIGSLVLQGKLGSWELNPLSLFGLYPFSGYPIGGVLLFAVLEYFLRSIILTFFVYSSLCAVIAVLLSFKVFRKFSTSVELSIIGALIYSTFPDFLLYTYLSGSIRGLFIALLPGFYLVCLRFYKKPNITNFLLLIGGVIFLCLFHRTGMVLIVWIFILVCLVVIQRINFKNFFINYKKQADYFERIIYVILAIFSIFFMFLSTYFIKINYKELANPWFGVNPGINAFISVFIDFCLRIGPVLFISLLGILKFLKSKYFKQEGTNKDLSTNFLFLFILSPFYAESLYLTLLIDLPLMVFSIQFLDTIVIENNYKLRKSKYSLIGIFFIIFNSFYYLSYDIIIIQVGFYVLIFLLLSFCFIILFIYSHIETNFIGTKKFNRIFYSILILSVILFSTFQASAFFERNNTFPYDYLTNQETQLANKLKELNNQSPVGRILISDTNLATHIMALTGFLSFYDPYFMSYLVDGSINASSIENNSWLRPINQWYNNYIYNTNFSSFSFDPNTISNKLFQCNMTTAIPYFIKFHTRYVVTTNNTIVKTDWHPFNSTLISDLFLRQDSALIYSTQNLLLWRLTY